MMLAGIINDTVTSGTKYFSFDMTNFSYGFERQMKFERTEIKNVIKFSHEKRMREDFCEKKLKIYLLDI